MEGDGVRVLSWSCLRNLENRVKKWWWDGGGENYSRDNLAVKQK